MTTVSGEFRDMLPAWAVMVLLPVPVATFWADGSARDFSFAYLFLGCAILTADRFGRPSRPGTDPAADWRMAMTALGVAAAGMVAVFTAFVWAMTIEPDYSVPLLAGLAVVPALACVPYPAIRSGRPYLAVLCAVCLLTGVKMAGCIVVVLVFGWDAQANGHTTLPWTRPNLLVWLCLGGAAGCSAILFVLGRRAFLARGGPEPSVVIQPS